MTILKFSREFFHNSLIGSWVLVIILCGYWFHPLGSRFCSLRHPSLPKKGLQFNSFLRLLSAYKVWGPKFSSFYIVFLFFSSSRRWFCQYNTILLKLCGQSINIIDSHYISQNHAHKTLWDKLFYILSFYGDCLGTSPLSLLEALLFDPTVLYGTDLDLSRC